MQHSRCNRSDYEDLAGGKFVLQLENCVVDLFGGASTNEFSPSKCRLRAQCTFRRSTPAPNAGKEFGAPTANTHAVARLHSRQEAANEPDILQESR